MIGCANAERWRCSFQARLFRQDWNALGSSIPAIGTVRNCAWSIPRQTYTTTEFSADFEDIDPKDADEARDDVLYFVTWVHGYLTGRYGFDQEKRPMGDEGIVRIVEDIAHVCDPDESKLFLEAVKDLK